MIGKEAQEYIEKNKDIIDKVIIIDYEGYGIKCMYYEDVQEVLKGFKWKDSRFKTDNGEWDTEEPYCDGGDVSYTILKGITFKRYEEDLEIEIYTKGYVATLKKMLNEGLNDKELFNLMKKYNTFI